MDALHMARFSIILESANDLEGSRSSETGLQSCSRLGLSEYDVFIPFHQLKIKLLFFSVSSNAVLGVCKVNIGLGRDYRIIFQ